MNARRQVLSTVLCGIASFPRSALADNQTRLRRVVALTVTNAESATTYRNEFEGVLRERGWTDGRDIRFEWRHSAASADRLAALANEAVKDRPDVILAIGNSAIAAARTSTSAIPIVMVAAQDPVGAGFVTSLARPGGNITGMTANAGVDILAKRLQLLTQIVPKARRIGVLRVMPETSEALFAAVVKAAEALGLSLVVTDIQSSSDLNRVFGVLAEQRLEALFLSGGSTLHNNMTRICDFAIAQRLAATYGLKEYARAGLLMSYGLDMSEQYRRAAVYIDRILRGTVPGEMPVEQPTKFDLTINLKTARAIGVEVPRSVLLRADEVIE